MKEKVKLWLESICTFVALGIDVSVYKELLDTGTITTGESLDALRLGLVGSLILLIMIYLFYKKYKKQSNKVINVLSVIFTIFMIFGNSYAHYGNSFLVFGNIWLFILAVLMAIGYYSLFKLCILKGECKMKTVIKKAVAVVLCVAMLISVSVVGALAATETECGGNCGHSPVIVLPGINHSPTYLYDADDKPVMNGDSQVGGTLLILNEAALSAQAIVKVAASAIATIAFQTNVGLDKVAYDLVCDLFKYQRCDENGDHVENLKTQRWNYSLERMTEDELEWTYRMVPMKALVDEIGEDHTYFFTFNLVGDPMDSADDLDEYIDMVKKSEDLLLKIELKPNVIDVLTKLKQEKAMNVVVENVKEK